MARDPHSFKPGDPDITITRKMATSMLEHLEMASDSFQHRTGYLDNHLCSDIADLTKLLMHELGWSWSQPVCESCFEVLHPDRFPIRSPYRDHEICVRCGKDHVSGIYIRINPTTAPYPSRTKDQ